MQDITFHKVWRTASQTDREEVTQLWKRVGAVPDEGIDKRLEQLCVLARDAQGNVVGVTTAYELLHPQMDVTFYAVRVLVAEARRRVGLAGRLLNEVFGLLEDRFVQGVDRRAIGMLVEVQNALVQRTRREAVWPVSKMVYVGKSSRGNHVRVRYFEGGVI